MKLFLAFTVFLGSCGSAASKGNGQVTLPTSYDNGVYYFDCTQANFGRSLSAFIIAHPELEVTAMTGNGTGIYGYDEGYFVVVRKKS
jgi:hypothetical protein